MDGAAHAMNLLWAISHTDREPERSWDYITAALQWADTSTETGEAADHTRNLLWVLSNLDAPSVRTRLHAWSLIAAAEEWERQWHLARQRAYLLRESHEACAGFPAS